MSATTAPMPERALAAAVIEQAWNDARALPVAVPGNQSAGRPSAKEHLAAREFLTAPQGRYARMREIWAERAGIDAEALRDRAARSLPPPQVTPAMLPRPADRGITARLLLLLQQAAEQGARAPTNRQLAAQLGTSDGSVAQLVLRLRESGLIRIETTGRRRVIAAGDGSWRTATLEEDPA